MSDRDWFGTTEETQQNKEAEGVAEELSAADKDGEQNAEAAEVPQNTSDIRQEGSTPNQEYQDAVLPEGNQNQGNANSNTAQGYPAGNSQYRNPAAYGQGNSSPGGQAPYNGPYYQGNSYGNTDTRQNPNMYQNPNTYQNPNAYQNPNIYQNSNTYQNPGRNRNPFPNGNSYQQMNGQPGYQGYYPESPYQGTPIQPAGPEEPMKISDWIVTLLVLSIPCVGLVMLFVWGFGSTENQSRANFCKAALIWSAILLVLAFIFYMVVLAGVISGLG